MTDIALDTTRELNVVFAETAEIRDFKEAETLAVGDVVYVTSAGKVAKADGSAAGTAHVRGIVVKRQGSTVSILKKGYLAGFDLSGVAYDAPLYLSDSTGKLADAAGTKSNVVGRVSSYTNDSLTKILYVECDWRVVIS